MRLDYGTQLSPNPIKLSVGTLKKPKLFEIQEITFDKFSYYETFLKITPELFYTKIKGEDGEKYWNSLTEEEQNKITLYEIILNEKGLQDTYVEIFNFFFVEPIIFTDDCFIVLNKDIENVNDIDPENDIYGIISENILKQVLEIIQQVCGIYEEDKVIKESKFKNKLAKKLYEKMQKAEKKARAEKKGSKDYSLPNIISAVSNRHPSITPLNVWELTIFQLLDSFKRLQMNSMFEINSTRVSVWGDEKKTFDATAWYKNEYD